VQEKNRNLLIANKSSVISSSVQDILFLLLVLNSL